MTRCHWRWSAVALAVIGRSDPAWLRSFYTHTVVLTLITENNNGGGDNGTMQLPVTSSPVRSRREKFPLLCTRALGFFPLALHFETWPREPSAAKERVRQRRVAVLRQLVPTSSRCSNASFCSGDRALSVRRGARLPGRTKEPRKRDPLGTAFFTRCHAPILNLGGAVAVTREGTWPRPLEEGDKGRLRPLTLGSEP